MTVLGPTPSLPLQVRELAQEQPDFPAIIEVEGVSVSYCELDEMARSWAATLRGLDVTAGQTVLTMLGNCIGAYAAWLGVGWLRAIEVAVNTGYRGDMLRYVINFSEAPTMVVAPAYVERLLEIAPGLDHLATVVVTGTIPAHLAVAGSAARFRLIELGSVAAEPLGAGELAVPAASDISAIILTSGTTGPAKGVLVPWAHWYWWGQAYGEGNDFILGGERCYSAFSTFHASGKGGFNILVTSRGTMVLRSRFSVSNFWGDIRKYDVKSAAFIGPMISMLLQAPPRPDDRDHPLERIDVAPVVPGMEVFLERFGIRKFTTVYGMSEIALPISAGWNPRTDGTCGRVRKGRPGYELRVVDEHDAPVPPNTVGELIVRASEPWVMNAGYWRMPQATADAWRNGWFHTGDGFKVNEDGWFYFVDRLKDTLRRRGENISSFEVEALVGQHPDVEQVAVIGVPSELSEDEVKAVIVRRLGSELSAEGLIEYLIPRMADFMVPRYVEFVQSLPLTEATARTQKAKLRADALNARTWDREQTRLRRYGPAASAS
jgi:crotonobetaine/carnitine-CoA ligase